MPVQRVAICWWGRRLSGLSQKSNPHSGLSQASDPEIKTIKVKIKDLVSCVSSGIAPSHQYICIIVESYFHAFYTSHLVEIVRFTPWPLYSRESNHGSLLVASWVGLRAVRNALRHTKCFCREMILVSCLTSGRLITLCWAVTTVQKYQSLLLLDMTAEKATRHACRSRIFFSVRWKW